MDADEETIATAPWWMWLLLCFISCASFWCQATVTEERLVPALNIIADYFNIPDDIAGATLMAAGASSPELFSSIVALFITHSSLGLGTIVGSEIFNQLIICAGSIYSSRNGKVHLDKAIVTREVGFYLLAIILLYIALQDHEPVSYDTKEHIFISFWEACMIFSGYVLYVLVCANFQAIVKMFSKKEKEGEMSPLNEDPEGKRAMYAGEVVLGKRLEADAPSMKYVVTEKSLSDEPTANWKNVEMYVPPDSEMFASSGRLTGASSFDAGTMKGMENSARPSRLRGLYDEEADDAGSKLSCFMWQKSYFYTKAYYAQKAWHLRWFTITPDSVTSLPDRCDAEVYKMKYPKFTQIEADEDHLIIKIVNPNSNKRDYVLLAPNKNIFVKFIESLKTYMENNQGSEEDPANNPVEGPMEEELEHDHYVDLIDFPSDGSYVEKFFWILLSPLRFLMQFSVPDVRKLDEQGNPKHGVGFAFLSTFMCLVWLVVGSYAMVASLEDLAELLNVPDSVIGVTVSAAGTSLPNYVASAVAARAGYGNQAVSNAFGSNTFNIMVGLGLPWLLYTSFGTGFEPYSGLREDGITLSIILLGGTLLVFIVLMLSSGFVMHKWHGHLFVGMYIAYITFSIAQVYV